MQSELWCQEWEVVTLSIIGLISNYLKPFFHLSSYAFLKDFFYAFTRDLSQRGLKGRKGLKNISNADAKRAGKSRKQIKITSRINFRT